MRERGFVLSVILILAAAMFSGMLTESEGPSGQQFRSHTKNIDVLDLKEQYLEAVDSSLCEDAGGIFDRLTGECSCGKEGVFDPKTHFCLGHEYIWERAMPLN